MHEDGTTPTFDTAPGRPQWATDFDPECNVWQYESSEAIQRLCGASHRLFLNRATHNDGTPWGDDCVFLLGSDEPISVPEARKLAKALTDLCDRAEGTWTGYEWMELVPAEQLMGELARRVGAEASR